MTNADSNLKSNTPEALPGSAPASEQPVAGPFWRREGTFCQQKTWVKNKRGDDDDDDDGDDDDDLTFFSGISIHLQLEIGTPKWCHQLHG